MVERELEPGEAAIVDARVAEHLRRERALRVEAALLRIEAEAGQVLALQNRRPRGVGLALDVDEAQRAVGERGVHLALVEPEDARGGRRLAARVAHLARVGVDRRRLLADRELQAAAVEDRSAGRGNRHVLVVLVGRQLPERARAHALQPGRAEERDPEGDPEDREQQPDAAVGDLRVHRGPGPSRT